MPQRRTYTLLITIDPPHHSHQVQTSDELARLVRGVLEVAQLGGELQPVHRVDAVAGDFTAAGFWDVFPGADANTPDTAKYLLNKVQTMSADHGAIRNAGLVQG